MSAEKIDHGMTDLPQVSQLNGPTGGCCQFLRSSKLTGVLALTACSAIIVAAYFAGQASQSQQNPVTSQLSVPLIDATGSVSGEGYSMATGYASESGEALFVLDHNSGLLQCSILYPRAKTPNKVMSLFTATVTEALGGSGKGSKYIMVTGRTDFPNNNQTPAAPTVVYVLDTSSGNWVAYGIPFNRQNMNALRQQQGLLIPVGQGTANPVIERDAR